MAARVFGRRVWPRTSVGLVRSGAMGVSAAPVTRSSAPPTSVVKRLYVKRSRSCSEGASVSDGLTLVAYTLKIPIDFPVCLIEAGSFRL